MANVALSPLHGARLFVWTIFLRSRTVQFFGLPVLTAHLFAYHLYLFCFYPSVEMFPLPFSFASTKGFGLRPSHAAFKMIFGGGFVAFVFFCFRSHYRPALIFPLRSR